MTSINRLRFYIIPITHSTIPYTTLATVPYAITGPAMVNIFAPTPGMNPSAAVNIGHTIFAKIFTLKRRCGIMK